MPNPLIAFLLMYARTSDWPPQGSPSDPHRRAWYTVPMPFIERLFQQETWQKIGRSLPSSQQPFPIPRTGAHSLYINSFSTMPQSENQRVLREETAEIMAVEKAQPAHKKRIVYSGEVEEQRKAEHEIMDQVVSMEVAQGGEGSTETYPSKQKR